MQIPEIEQKVKTYGRRISFLAVFLGLCLPDLHELVQSHTIFQLDLFFMVISVIFLALTGYSTTAVIRNNYFFNSRSRSFSPAEIILLLPFVNLMFSFYYLPLFINPLTRYIKRYINKSSNLTEKKYKTICLKLWMDDRGIVFGRDTEKTLFTRLARELRQKGETKYNLSNLFRPDIYTPHVLFDDERKINGTFAKDFLNEDKFNPEKLEIAKKVYTEFSQFGMAGRAFISGHHIDEILFFQDYQLNEIDYEYIKEFTKDLDERINVTFGVYDDNQQAIIKKTLTNENNINNVEILEIYFYKMLIVDCNKKSINNNWVNGEIFLEEMNNYLKYLKMNLQVKEKNQSIPKKINKI